MNTTSLQFLATTACAGLVVCGIAFGYPRPTRYNCVGGGLDGGRIVRIFPPVLIRKPNAFGDIGQVSLKGLVLPRIFDQAKHCWRDPSHHWFARYRWVQQYEFTSLSLIATNRPGHKPTVQIAFKIPLEHLQGLAFQNFLLRWEHTRHARLMAIGPGRRVAIPLRAFRPLTLGGRLWHLKLFRFAATISPRQTLVLVRRPAWRMRIESRADPHLHFPAFRIHSRQRRLLLRFFRRAKLPTQPAPRPPVKHKPDEPATRP